MKRAVLLSLLMMVPAMCFSQELTSSSTDSSNSTLIIRTDVEGALVYLNSDSIGVTPLSVQVRAGRYFIRVIPPDIQNWLNDVVRDSLTVEPNTAQTLSYSLARRTLVLSIPSGAQVVVADSVIGTTPLAVSDFSSATLKMKSFEEIHLEAANVRRGIVSAQMKKNWNTNLEETSVNVSEERGSSVKIYLAGAATLVAGSAAAYFKVKADNTYSEYQMSGNPDMQAKTDRLDTAAGIALVATQISLGLFTYFVLSEP